MLRVDERCMTMLKDGASEGSSTGAPVTESVADPLAGVLPPA